MKKFVMLCSFTVAAIAGVVLWGAIAKNSIVQVSTVKVNPITVEKSVICTGRVERIATTNAYSSVTGVVKDVFVKAGDKVRKGQTLAEVETVRTDSVPETSTSSLPSGIPAEYEDFLSRYGNQLSSQQSESETQTQKITAPVSGEITSVSVSGQNYLSAGGLVAVISDSGGLQVRLSVNESQISDIKVGQKAEINGVGFKNSSYTGTVKSISSDAKQVINTTGQETVVEVVVSVNAAGSDIKPGYTAKVKIITSQNPNVLIVPYETVQADKDGNEFVYKLSGNQAVKTPIVTRDEFDRGFEVAKGLTKNDVVIENPDNLSNGARVIPTESAGRSSDD